MPQVIALVDDLMFLSRIREAARATGVELQAVRGGPQLLAAVRDGARLVLVDADSQRLPWRAAVETLRGEPAAPPIPVVAFVSHVNADHAAAARAAGASRVLARSAFVAELPELLGRAARNPLEEPAP